MPAEWCCPSCGAEGALEPVEGGKLSRCALCGTVHRTPKELPPRIRPVKTIVSRGSVSMVCSTELPEADEVAVGDHLVSECGEDVFGVEVASIEAGGRRVARARVPEITALWTRGIEQVSVKFSVHDGWKTIPLLYESDGEEPFVIGETFRIGTKRFRITHIKLRDGAMLRKEGWRTVAKRIRRIYGRLY